MKSLVLILFLLLSCSSEKEALKNLEILKQSEESTVKEVYIRSKISDYNKQLNKPFPIKPGRVDIDYNTYGFIKINGVGTLDNWNSLFGITKRIDL